MLYSSKVETVVVLTPNGRDSIEREINERLAGTIEAERGELAKLCIGKTAAQKREIIKKNKIKNRVNVLVREGDTFSTKKLNDISIMRAKSIVILADDMKSTVCQYEKKEYIEKREKGNTATIKTLIQVAEMTGRAESADNQIIVVEVNDNWTQYLVSRIINHKQIAGKCHIVPIMVSKTLGQILSQFAIMPELNSVYGELFSNKGAQFFSRKMDDNDSEEKHVRQVMDSDCTAIPLAALEDEGGRTFYYLANSDRDVNELVQPSRATLKGGVELKLKENFWLEKRNVIILGHNSRMEYLMEGFNAFASEWNFSDEKLIEENGGKNILNIVIVDEQSELERQDYMNRYEAVTKVVAADAYDREQVCSALNEFIDSHDGDTSVLILSDDMVGPEEVDANPLTYLVYVQDIIAERRAANPDFDSESIDVIVEIINPKNYDIVHSYSVDNIVISNRYISKMLTQIGEKDDIYKFYCDILTYDDNNQVFESKEMYIKKVSRFFTQIPGKCTAAQLIRAVYNASPADNRSIVCGYVRKGGQVVIFSGNQENIPVMLCETDKLIIFSNH
jgi:hypothetical protein